MHPRSLLASLSCLGLLTAGCSSDDPSASASTSAQASSSATTGAGGGGGEGATSGSGGEGGGGSETPELDAYIQEKMVLARMPGLSACIVKGGAVVWCKGYGFASIEAARPATPDTVYMIASISKTVTATALMQEWEKGAFDLGDDVAPSLGFSAAHPTFAEPITFRGLLTHTASVRDNWNIMDGFYAYGTDPTLTLAETVAGYFDPAGAYYDAAANFTNVAPGSEYEYSDMGVALAGHLVEALTGEDFADRTKQAIFEPLLMDHTSWWLADFAEEDLAVPYEWQAGSYSSYGQYSFSDYPDGGLRTSASDLARFLAAITQGGALDGARILEDATVTEMLSAQVPAIDDTQGIVFYHFDYGGEDWAGHSGGESGVAADMFWRTSDGLGYVVLMNGDWADEQPIYDIEDALTEYGETL